jgi:muramoyltetrapeptide carboxypeptidase
MNARSPKAVSGWRSAERLARERLNHGRGKKVGGNISGAARQPVNTQPHPALRPGALIGVVALSGPARRSRAGRGVALLRARGYRVKLGRHVFARHGYLAGEDAQRVADLNRMLRDPEVEAVLFARGGYGMLRLLPRVDWGALRRRPRLLVGFSDATALFAAARRLAGAPSLHGPSATTLAEPARYHAPSFWAGLAGRLDRLSVPFTPAQVVRPGMAHGELAGGCLSLLASLAGPPYEPDLRGRILFWEDVNEEPFRIDRMLQQLRLAGMLRGVRGVVVGRLTNCRPKGPSLREIDLLREFLVPLGVPVVRGVRAGHCLGARSLPLGARTTLDTRRGLLSFSRPRP